MEHHHDELEESNLATKGGTLILNTNSERDSVVRPSTPESFRTGRRGFRTSTTLLHILLLLLVGYRWSSAQAGREQSTSDNPEPATTNSTRGNHQPGKRASFPLPRWLRFLQKFKRSGRTTQQGTGKRLAGMCA